MKNKARLLFITLIVLFAIICMPAKSQTYIPIPLDSTLWKVNYWAALPWPYSWTCSVFEYTAGDTVINTKNYTLIKTLYDPFCTTHISPIKKAAIRQDSLQRKVFIIWLPDSLTERILYDFTQTAGDTCNSILYSSLCGAILVQSVDSVSLNGKYHRRINLHGNCCDASLIEGIGSSYGLIDKLFAFENGNSLMCVHDFKHGDKTIFPDSTTLCDTSSVGITENKSENYKLEVYPNPFDNIINFEYLFPIKNIHIYNLLGQEIYYLLVNGKQKVQLNRKEFVKGLFLYRVETNDKRVFTGKLVAE